jgi:hypothetical protein
MFISSKHEKHTTLKELVNPQTQMIPTMHQWEKIVKDLQRRTKGKFP